MDLFYVAVMLQQLVLGFKLKCTSYQVFCYTGSFTIH